MRLWNPSLGAMLSGIVYFFCLSQVVVWSVDIHPAHDHYVKHRKQSYKSMSNSRVYVARPSPPCSPHSSSQEHPAENCIFHKNPADEASERASSQEATGPLKSTDWLVTAGTPHAEW